MCIFGNPLDFVLELRLEKDILMNVIKAPDERLRVKTKPVNKITPELRKIASEMIEVTKSFQDPEGVGLASTQIGRNERFFVAKFGKEFKACFNPKILSYSKKTKKFFEGCLSIPNFWGEVVRPIGVRVSFEDENGKPIIRSLRGLSAWIFQHEVDHLNSHLFMDKVLEQKGRIFKTTGKDTTGADVFEEISLV